MLMIRPLRCATRCGIANLEHRNAPVRLTASVRSQSSARASATDAVGPAMPALLTRMSSRPNSRTVDSTSFVTAGSPGAAGTTRAHAPAKPAPRGGGARGRGASAPRAAPRGGGGPPGRDDLGGVALEPLAPGAGE